MSKYLSIRARALGVLIFALAISTLQVPYAAQASACSPTTSSYADGGNSYNVVSFTTVGSDCSWTAPSGVTTIDLLLIGGGGGGGGYAYAGGGGGGGFAEVMAYSVTPGSTYAVTVGDGGSGGAGNGGLDTQGQNGGESSFQALTVLGGGGGGGWENEMVDPRDYSPGRSGASGGGASENGGAGGAVSQTLLSDGTTPVFGYAGGSNLGRNVYSGAGGGGAGGLGESVTQSDTPSAGGIGKASTIRTGSPITYSAGGTGGPGLYYPGSTGNPNYTWSDASSNTGDGGGGAKYTQSYSPGAKGGSGIVVVRYQLPAGITPSFGSPTATADGFYVTITNYDANYTWDTPTVTSGSVAAGSPVGSNRVLTVTGLSPSDSATITQGTRRSGYSNGSNTVSGTASTGAALTPSFGSVTRTADGFYVTITNYDANYTWDTPTVSSGSVAITSTSTPNRVLTVTGLSPTDSATITQATSRSGYSNGSNTVAGTALSAALNPSFGSVTRTIGGFSVAITNYDSNYTWNTPTVSSGSVAVTSTNTGDVWSAQTNSAEKSWRAIASSSDGTKLAAVVENGYIYTSVDSGATWTEQTSSGSRVWLSITSSSDGTKLAAAVWGGYIYTSTNSGVTWTERNRSGVRYWKTITSSSDGSKIVAAEYDGRIATSNDSGATWNRPVGAKNWESIAASSDGTKLAVVVYGGAVWTSVDSGSSWTATGSGSRNWRAIASSSDGAKLAAVVYGDYIYTSTNSGATWTARTSAGLRNWQSITSSSDGTKLAAVVDNGAIYTSVDSGVTWLEQTNPGSMTWRSIASSSDGSKYAAVAESGKIYTFTFRVLTVTGLTDGESATITQTTSRSNYATGSNTVLGTALSPLNPTFGTVTRVANGFSVSITNYDANYTWGTPTVTTGSVSITSTDGATRVLTVTGLSAADSATITQGTSRSNYPSGSNTVIGYALSAALNPIFGDPTPTADGFSVSITNYDADFIWDTPTVSSGTVAITSTDGSTRVLTVSGLSANGSATITQTTSRTNYVSGSNTATSKTINSALNPIFGTVTRIANGFIVPITNYDADFTWDAPTESSGSVSINAANSSANWTEQTGAGARIWEFIASSSDGTKLAAVAQDGYIYTSANSGTTWTEHASVGSQLWRSIASSSDGTKLAATVFGGNIWTSIDSGVNWTEQTNIAPQLWRTIASSSDGTKLSAVVNGGYIWTSTDSGATWIEQTGSRSSAWRSLASNGDGSKLAAGTLNKYIWTSSDSGVTWIERTSSGQHTWRSITSNSDGTKFAAVAEDGYICTSTDSGVTWTAQTNAGSHSWRSITSSSDGTKLAAVALDGYVYTSTDSGNTWSSLAISGLPGLTDIASSSDGTKIAATVFGSGYIYTFAPRVLTVTGLSAGETANITQSTRRSNYPNGSNTVSGMALSAALNPIFDSATATSDGFSIYITNFDANFTWDTPTVSRGSVEVTSTDGTNRVLTVTGLTAGDSATITQTNSRSGYVSGTNTGTGRTLIVITDANVSITAPVTGATPVTSTSGTQYNTTITWSESPSRFAGTTRYTATVTVTPNAGYMLNGVVANLFTVNSYAATTGNLVNAGSFTYRFAATGAKLAQIITFAQPADMSMTSDTQTLSATSSATGSYPVSLTSNTTGICSVTNRAITVLAPGICSIRASQAGDGIYSAAASIIKSIAITSNKLTQSITFAQPAAMNTRSSNQALTATTSAGGSYLVSLTSNTPLICTISSRAIVVVKSGNCSITASQAGNGSYQAATSVTRTVVISKVAQTITFSQPAAMTVTSNPRALSATTTADGRTVGFSSSSAACIVAEGVITVAAAGTCVITASQAGDDTYTAATSVTKSLVISKLTQTITFPQLDPMTITSSDQLLSATTNAIGSYSIGYASANTAICTIVASGPARSVHVVAPGTCSITATQLGDGTYTAAAIVNTFVIAKRTQTITFATPAVMTLSSVDQALSASSSAGGSYAVKFTSTTPSVCTIVNNNSVHIVSAGACSITASQAGNAIYAPANNVMKSFIVASSKRR